MDDLIIAAGINGGYLMRHQLLDLGHSDAMIRQHTRAGVLERIRHGTYAIAASWRDLPTSGQHKVLTNSVLDKLGPGVVASHQSAAAQHDLDLFDLDLSSVHVTRIDGRTGRREAGIVYHEGGLVESDFDEIGGRLVVEPIRAVLEVGMISSTESTMVLASSALRVGTITKDELVAYGDGFRHWRGTRSARIAIRLADGRLASAGEVRSLHMMWRHHLPHPELQFVVADAHGRFVARTDFAWVECRHLGEFDGLFKYGRLNPHATDPGQAISDEKIREDLARDELFGMSRWVWAGLAGKAQAGTAADIHRGMARSRKLYARNATVIPLG